MTEQILPFSARLLISLALAPLLPGIINRVKAIFAGRHGKPLLQTYYDLWKLAHKSEVWGNSTHETFSLAPAVTLASSMLALLFLPLCGRPSPVQFSGDFILAVYLAGAGRFALLLGAMDTGSPFEGMGASREATFSALAEPAIFMAFLVLASVCLDTGVNISLSTMFDGQALLAWQSGQPELFLLPFVFFILLLVENCRIPVDDPNTHLELTMIHEVMILDYSGPNLAMITYASTLKLWFFSALVASLLVPPLPAIQGGLLWLGMMLLVGVAIGIVESCMARLKLSRVPRLLGMASALGALALILAQTH